MSYSVVCRGCLCADGSTLVDFNNAIIEMFSFCTGIETNAHESQRICVRCSELVTICYNFINMCRNTDTLLRTHCSNVSSESLENDVPIKSEFENDPSDVAVKIEITEDATPKGREFMFGKDTSCLRDSTSLLSSENDFVKVTKKGRSKKPQRCHICNKTCSSKKTLKLHLGKFHTKVKEFSCEFCSKKFRKIFQLKAHAKEHKISRQYNCEHCKKQYSLRSKFEMHLKIHADGTAYKCYECNKSFLSKHQMKKHSRQHEEDEHLCDLCGQKFTFKGNLKVHMRVHTGEKPYACSMCSFRCSSLSSIRRHERIHTETKPHVCPECNKSFNTSAVLQRHRRIHTGELPYECFYCPKAFIDTWKRKLHLVQVHNIPMADIPIMTPGRKRMYNLKKSINPCDKKQHFDDEKLASSGFSDKQE